VIFLSGLRLTVTFPQWYNQELNTDVSRPAALLYRKACIPISSLPQQATSIPMQSISAAGSSSGAHISALSQLHFQAPARGQSQPASGASTHPMTATAAQATTATLQSKFLEIYWCVDKPWSERQITLVRPLPVNDSIQDIQFCLQLLDEYHAVRGFRGKWFSWKTCVDVKFINVSSRCCELKDKTHQSPSSREFSRRKMKLPS